MTTPPAPLDLSKTAPRSPRVRIAGFALALRSADKCRSALAGTPGEYHYDCPLDKMLFAFKGITGDQFKAAVHAPRNDEEIGLWLTTNGISKTPLETAAWSDSMENARPIENPERRADFIANCGKVGINPETSTLFDWLEADDIATFRPKAEHTRLIFNP
ncbi:protein of unknown function [Verrucomicrobium sp. GAS474]|uniref:DUF5069 domain-containing protein n=1 Tax=Verrucomicrobium sp. GAS474 TaxID=1882831 RepID=UPI00087A0D95|nr:DUF5069 domain-containing protein [Verrucomicrobium sp. GAS474]SDU04944.1 protein of unknown function [Verrucomicrobium sp. GAS474]